MSTTATVVDPFLDDKFAPLDLRTSPEHYAALSQIAEDEPEFAPTPDEVLAADGLPPAPPAPVAAPTPAAPPQPEVTHLEDGASVSVQKGSKGWEATLTLANGAGSERFYGRTKDEMWLNVSIGKLNATKKIRELTKRNKLAVPNTPAPTQPAPTARQLTADDIFQIKTELAADPDKALSAWFQKKFGLSADELVRLAKRGAIADRKLELESVARAFVTEHEDDYYSSGENYTTMVAYLAKHKLSPPVQITTQNFEAVLDSLAENGQWTLQNLNEAFEELSADGLLETEPEEPDQTPEVQVAPPAPPTPPPAPPQPNDPRIASQRRQPRANLGIRQREVTTVPTTPDPRLPSDEDLDNLTDAEMDQLFAGIRKHKAASRR
jgi:hypothetical protein